MDRAGQRAGARSTGGAADGLKDPLRIRLPPVRLLAVRIEFPDAVTFRALRTPMRGRRAPQAGAVRPVSDGMARCACPGLIGGVLTRRTLPSKLGAINTHL